MSPSQSTGLLGTVFPRGKRYVFKVSSKRHNINIWKSHPTLEAANEHRLRVNLDLRDGRYIAPSKLTIEQFADRWLADKSSSLEPQTVYAYNSQVAAIVDIIGERIISQLTPSDIIHLQARLLDRYSPLTVRTIRTVLSSMLNDAVRWEIITRNPAAGVRPPKAPATEHTVWTVDQMRQFLDGVADHPDGALWTLIATTGIRPGEACGLQWDDLFGRQITIRRSVKHRTDENGKRQSYIGQPKSASGHRVLVLPEQTVQQLADHRQRLREMREEFGDWFNPGEFMFPSAITGTYYDPSSLSGKLRKLCRQLNLPSLHCRDLRHTYATLMAESGVHVRVAQQRLGHANPSTTLRIYTHVTTEMDADAVDSMDDRIRRSH